MSDGGRISALSIVQKCVEPISADIDGEVIAMSVNQGCFFGMNTVGSRIWQLIETPVRVKDIVDKLLNEYKVGADDCHQQVIRFLEDLLQAELIKIVDTGTE